ncbi:hypothetical protein BZM27_06015 [Paraburkholderia steynii]|uniref:Uncharacterized protein n=1 Tax=Paraburkholderia steynii TaxID=1245441 RepID=A0A4R0XGC2_9BURK|nr:hypothetical protein BZM27_06015 [Paraburkholderia steynii]
MARKPNALPVADEGEAEQKPVKYVLKRNAGLILDGRQNLFFPAGTVFDAESDAPMISALFQLGEILEQQ